MRKIWLIVGTLWLSIAIVAQTSTCSDIVFNAIDQTEDLCQDVGRNQICYGNQNVTASPATETVELVFDSPGNIENIRRIAAFDVAEFDEGQGIWGISLLKLQANLPDTTPGINVTILVFGDVEMIQTRGNRRMQAFSLSTGIGPVRCNELPDSGVVIQTPQGVGTVDFSINGVQLALGSTALIRSNEEMQIALLEGNATVTNADVSEALSAGELTTLPINPDGTITSPPTAPRPYTPDDVRGLPLQLLPVNVDVVESSSSNGEAPSPAITNPCSYVVQPGETLFRIALRSGSTVNELSQLNNISNPTRIFAGQRLILPTCIQAPILVPPIGVTPTFVPETIVEGPVNNCFPEIINYCDPGRPWGDGRCNSSDPFEQEYNYQQGWYAAALECGEIDSIPPRDVSCSVVADDGRNIEFTFRWSAAMVGQYKVIFDFGVLRSGNLVTIIEDPEITSTQTSIKVLLTLPYNSYDGGVAYVINSAGQRLTDEAEC